MLIGDSAFPPATYPTSFGGKPVVGWCVYIPGGNAYHGWSKAEFDHLRALPWCRYIVPVFVRSHPQGAEQAQADAAAVAAWIHAQGQPRGTLVMMDYETAVDSVYEIEFDRALREASGDLEVLYGSKSTVIKNAAPSGGYNEADWTGRAPGPLDSTAQQFYSCDAYDLNDFRDTAPLWDIRPASQPTAAPAAAEEDTMVIISVQGQTTIWGFAGARLWPIEGPAALETYRDLGVPEKTISADRFAAIQHDLARLKPSV